MHLERIFAHIVAGYLIAVGLFFGLASIFQISYIHIEPTGKFYVLGISAVFAASGACSFFLLRKGKLKKEGASLTEVRQEAIEKLKDPELLSQIAIKDADSELRETAMERLRELKETG
jgi:predicted CopG family antitoxin